jgi:hypothetical protein
MWQPAWGVGNMDSIHPVLLEVAIMLLPEA